jgi:LmbE family N-acetylglucosaminyl deacetylase
MPKGLQRRREPLRQGQPTRPTALRHRYVAAPVGPLDGYAIIATDGAQGASHTSIPRGSELARVRSEEARCSTDALGIQPPILLGFPDAQLGAYTDDRDRLFRLTQRVQEDLQRLRPNALITWGPDGGTGHPDHRLVSGVVTQLVRAGAPGVPERLFYVSIPAEGMRVMNPSRGAPPFLVPLEKYFQRACYVHARRSRSRPTLDGVPPDAVLG